MKRRFVRELKEDDRVAQRQEDDESDESSYGDQEEEKTGKRGRRAIPLAWTRVVLIKPHTNSRVTIHAIQTEVNIQKILRENNKRLTIPEYKLLFWPNEWARENLITDLEQFKLSDDQLKKIGKQATKIRTQLRARALRMTPENPQSENN